MKVLFIVWCCSCAWLSGMWLVFHIAVATDEKHHLTVLTSTVWSPSTFSKCQWTSFFSHGGIQWHTFASYALLCQMPFCQTAPLLPFVARQQHVMGYWQGGLSCTSVFLFEQCSSNLRVSWVKKDTQGPTSPALGWIKYKSWAVLRILLYLLSF